MASTHKRSFVPHLVAAAVALLLGTVGIDRLSDLTQDRPDPLLPDQESSVLISASAKGPARTPLEVTEVLWGACTTQLGTGYRALSMTEVGGSSVEVVVRPRIGRYAERRLRGCIADGAADKVGAYVQSITPVER